MNKTVEQVGRMSFEGNITPHAWYQSPLLQNERGKPNLVAITLLADLVYWYRPVVLRDEASGRETGRRQKFAGDKLRRTYAPWGRNFGLTRGQVEDAVAFLKRQGLVTVETRTVITEYGASPNCAFLEPVVEALARVTFGEGPGSPGKSGKVGGKKGPPSPGKSEGVARKIGARPPENPALSESPERVRETPSGEGVSTASLPEGEGPAPKPDHLSLSRARRRLLKEGRAVTPESVLALAGVIQGESDTGTAGRSASARG